MKLDPAKYLQLIPEGILFYFVLVPVFLFQQQTLPLWSYLVLVVSSILLIDIGQKLTQRYVGNVTLVVMFLLAVYGFGYPVLVPVLLGLFLIWRDHVYSIDGRSEQPLLVIAGAGVLMLLEIIFTQNTTLIWMGVIQVFVLIVGQWLNLFAAYGSLRKQMRRPFMTAAGAVLGGGILLYALFPIISLSVGMIYSGITWGLEMTGYGFASLIGDTDLDMPTLGREQAEIFNNFSDAMGDNMDELKFNRDEMSGSEQAGIPFINRWTILTVFFILGILSYFFNRKRHPKPEPNLSAGRHEATIHNTSLGKKAAWNQDRHVQMVPPAPENPIRKQVYQFEGEAYQKGLGRQSAETVEEWLLRLGFDARELNLYQQVRYGEQTLTDQEQRTFEQRLKILRSKLKEL